MRTEVAIPVIDLGVMQHSLGGFMAVSVGSYED